MCHIQAAASCMNWAIRFNNICFVRNMQWLASETIIIINRNCNHTNYHSFILKDELFLWQTRVWHCERRREETRTCSRQRRGRRSSRISCCGCRRDSRRDRLRGEMCSHSSTPSCQVKWLNHQSLSKSLLRSLSGLPDFVWQSQTTIKPQKYRLNISNYMILYLS